MVEGSIGVLFGADIPYAYKPKPTTRVMVNKGHREISILMAPLFLPKKPYWWPQGGPYFKTSPY